MTAAAPALACLREYLAGCAARHLAAAGNEASWAREACRPKVDTGMKQFYTRVKEQKARSKKQQLGSSSVESEGGKVTVVYVRRRREGGRADAAVTGLARCGACSARIGPRTLTRPARCVIRPDCCCCCCCQLGRRVGSRRAGRRVYRREAALARDGSC